MVVPGIRLWDKEFGDFGKLPILTINCARMEKLPGRLGHTGWMFLVNFLRWGCILACESI